MVLFFVFFGETHFAIEHALVCSNLVRHHTGFSVLCAFEAL